MEGTARISPSRRKSDALGRHRAVIARVMETSPFRIQVYDLIEHRFVYQNRELAADLGYTAAQIVELGCDCVPTLMHPDDLRLRDRQLEWCRTARDGDVLDVVGRLRDAAGDWRWIKDRVTVFARGADGRPRQLLAMSADITEQRRAEEELLHVQKMDSLGRFAGGIAHDLNNILTAIFGFGELARAELRDGDAALAPLVQIRTAADRARDLTNQLLAFARKQVIQPIVLDVSAALQRIHAMLARLMRADIELSIVSAAEAMRVRMDPGQLDQIVLNLALNARDAMPDGGQLVIRSELAELTGPGPGAATTRARPTYVLLSVSDSGVGIDASLGERIFEPFLTTKGLGAGIGLGLATCHGIVKQNDGHIRVVSRPGHGTTFQVYLPRVAAADVEPIAAAAPRPVGGAETILLAEDDPVIRRLAALTLRFHGYKVLEAADGRQALAVLAAHSGEVHLLLTDVIMPAMRGDRLAEEVCRTRTAIKVVFMSGYTDDAPPPSTEAPSAAAFLQKPYTPRVLAETVRGVLDAPTAFDRRTTPAPP